MALAIEDADDVVLDADAVGNPDFTWEDGVKAEYASGSGFLLITIEKE